VNTKVLLKLLSRLNITADVASNGQESLDRSKERHYDYILMDIEMPIMNGIEACKKLREMPEYKDIPIVGFTAHVLSTEEQKRIF
jgi:CheY-like chemotaxis protein